MDYHGKPSSACAPCESGKLEAVTTCVGFDDMLDLNLGLNHSHVDHFIVVTSHEDRATQLCARKHGARVVVTDLFRKNGRSFNKGAAINAGFDYFQWNGWRLHLDCDIILPDNFRRVLFNHHVLDPRCLYGATRRDVTGREGIDQLLKARVGYPQHAWGSGISGEHNGTLRPGPSSSSEARFVDSLRGYCPIGFFQLWHAQAHQAYPFSLGTAAHDDVMFAALWREAHRHLLPGVICYHLCATTPYFGQNWDGNRRQPRL
jgi:hypothetical protein